MPSYTTHTCTLEALVKRDSPFKGPQYQDLCKRRLTVKHAQEERKDKGKELKGEERDECDKSTQDFRGTTT